MSSKYSCLTEDRIEEVVFEAEVEALEGLHNSGWKPGHHNLRNNAFHPRNELEEVLFKKVQEVTERCFKMGQGTFGTKPNSTGGAHKSKRSKKSGRMTRRH